MEKIRIKKSDNNSHYHFSSYVMETIKNKISKEKAIVFKHIRNNMSNEIWECEYAIVELKYNEDEALVRIFYK